MIIGRLKKEINWDILVLMLLGALKLGPQIFFLLSSAYFLWQLLHSRGCFRIPKVPGIHLYLIVLIYSTVLGTVLYAFRSVLRDLYYILPTLVWIFIGYYMQIRNHGRVKNLMETLYLYGGITAMSCIITFFLHFSLDFNSLRAIFGANVYDIGFILPVLIMEVLLFKRTVFTKVWDRFLISAMLIQIMLSFGRIALIEPAVELCVIAFLAVKYKPDNKALSFRVAAVLGIVSIGSVLLFYALPDSIINPLLNKFSLLFTEIDTSQEILSVGEAMNNWRAYEIQAAQEQWRGSGILVRLFGAGMGKGVHLEYVPYTWQNIVQDDEIPLLHNGFYSLLPKGGIVAVASLAWMFLGSIRYGLKNCRIEGGFTDYGIVLTAVSTAAIANTYVVCGPVKQGAFLVWAVLLGGICSELHTRARGAVHEK